MAGKSIVHMVSPAGLPMPGGHYSYATIGQGQVYVSGLLPIDAQGRPMADAGFDAQAAQVLSNLSEVLLAAGSGIEQLLHVRVYIESIEYWGRFNSLYADWVGSHRPARAIVPTGPLHFGLKLEIEAVALTGMASP